MFGSFLDVGAPPRPNPAKAAATRAANKAKIARLMGLGLTAQEAREMIGHKGVRAHGGGGGSKPITDPLFGTGRGLYDAARLEALGFDHGACGTGYEIGERVRLSEGTGLGTNRAGRRITKRGTRQATRVPFCAFPGRNPLRTTAGFVEGGAFLPGNVFMGSSFDVGGPETDAPAQSGWMVPGLIGLAIGVVGTIGFNMLRRK